MAYSNAEELYKIFGATIDKISNDEALSKKLGNLGIVLGLEVPNLDAFITIECKGSLVPTYGPPTIETDAVAIQNDEIFNKFWQGKLNLMVAMTKGHVKMKGAITKMIKLLPIINPVYNLYAESLKEAGREDLVLRK